MTDTITTDSLSRGFSAGNYASAYTSADLDTAWEVMEDGDRLPHNDVTARVFRAAFMIGFFSSYEDDEVPGDHLDELLAAHKTLGPMMRELGIAVDAREGEAGA